LTFVGVTTFSRISNLLSKMGSARVENGDSKTYRLDIKVSGSGSTLEIRSSTTATYSWSGGSHNAEVKGGGIAFPGGVIKDGGHYKVKDGRASEQ
jgi:hypothetical protein